MMKTILLLMVLLWPVFAHCLEYQEKFVGHLETGMNDGVDNDEMFPLASRAHQSLCVIGNRMFTTVPVNKKTRARILEYRKNGGKPVAVSSPLPIGHGQGLGCLEKNGQVWLYAQNESGTGISEIRWNGKETVVSRSLVTVPDGYSMFTPTVSTDGKHLVGFAFGDGREVVCMIAELKNPAQTLRTFPVFSKIASGTAWQSIAADSRNIYLVYGGVNALKPHVLAVYDYDGNMVHEQELQDEKAHYSDLMNNSQGTPWNIELEGIGIDGDSLLITGIATVNYDGDVVEFNGKRFMCISNTLSAPLHSRDWIPTRKAVTRGQYCRRTTYFAGKGPRGEKFMKRYRYVYRLVKK